MYPVPSQTEISFGYGETSRLYRDKRHKGDDFSARKGAKVVAAVSGKVVHAGPNRLGPHRGWGKSYGIHVIIDCDRFPDGSAGLWAGYMHLSAVDVKVGQRVKAGQRIGAVGSTGNSTGNHLHFEIQRTRFWGGWLGSKNPQKWLSA
jgi:murein DD-endopeptidase MepM/ murein hydrolase activator NlpD